MYVPCLMDICDSVEEKEGRSAAVSENDTSVVAASRHQYRTLESLVALLPALASPTPAGEEAVSAPWMPAACYLALRAALAPTLKPYRDDPLLPLDGEFISVDAQIDALLAFVRDYDLLAGLLSELPHADRLLLPASLLSDTPHASRAWTPAFEEASHVGSIWGSLYLPAAGAAVPCRIWAAYGPDSASYLGEQGWRWPDPRPVRFVSADIAQAAQDALAAALAILGRQSAALLSAPLTPGIVYYDVCCPDLGGEDTASAVAGRSLGLPLALAFLSALTGMEILPFVGATGALDREAGRPDAIQPVAWTMEKAAAHRPLSASSRFLVPRSGTDLAASSGEDGQVQPATDLIEAARLALCGFSAALDKAPSGESSAPAAPPVGERIAFLRTEIQGAVQLWETEPAAMRRAVAEYETLFQEAVSSCQGFPFGARTAAGAIGALSAAFPTVAAASAAALELQQRLLLHPWPRRTGTLRTRIGIHQGGADLFGGDYYGPVLAQLARLSDTANAGQILLSGAARTGLVLPEGADWHLIDLGSHRLRDLGEAMPLYQLSRPGLPDAFDPPRSLENKRHNLPVQVTSFVGRTEEIAALRALLLDTSTGAGARLVTLYGPGGVGKTRLALQVAAECAAAEEAGFEGGVQFIPLTDARTPEEAAAVLAQVLRAPAATAKRTLLDQVIATLDGVPGRTLLLLDNAESILPQGAALIGQIVQGAPRCTILITSRVLVNLRGERRFEVTPLQVPSEQEAQEDALLARAAPSLALFRARAREVSPGFDRPAAEGGTGEVSVPLLCAICRRLDGLPLAIELAAARVRHLSLAEIERRLEDAFSLLVTRTQDIPERHRTLLATLHWSYNLLDDEERRFFAHLAVFAGGFTEAAAATVTRWSDAFDLLTALEEKSLIRCEVGAGENPTGARYSLLNMVQDFARQRLAESGEQETATAAHAAYYMDLAHATAPTLDTSEEVAAFDALDREIDNLRAAHASLMAARHDRLPAFVAAVGEFLYRRGHWHEWAEWPHHALTVAENGTAANPETLARLHFFIAVANRNAGDIQSLTNRILRALHHADQIQEAGQRLKLRADAMNLRGMRLLHDKQFAEAETALTEARDIYCEIGHARGEAVVMNNLGHAAYCAGDFLRSQEYYDVSAAFCRANGDRRGLYHALNNIALMALEAGERERARDLFREALAVCRPQKDAVLIGTAMLNLGDALEQCGEAHAALAHLVAAEQVFLKLGHRYHSEAATYIDRCCRQNDALQEAVERLRQEGRRRSLASFLVADPSAKALRLQVEPQTITLDGAQPAR